MNGGAQMKEEHSKKNSFSQNRQNGKQLGH